MHSNNKECAEFSGNIGERIDENNGNTVISTPWSQESSWRFNSSRVNR